MSRRTWDEGEYIVALYLYKYGYVDLGLDYTQIATIINRSPNSIIMRFANFLSVENDDAGLSGGGKKTREIYDEYKDISREELKKIAKNYLYNKQNE
ncbi:hypothetical protein [Natronospora cellulosivora (SeqCode)]